MPYSSGTFTFTSNSFSVPVTGTVISSSAATSTWSDISTALSTCMLKDGTQTLTANIPFGTFGISSLGFITGTTTNDNAPVGGIGQLIESNVALGSAVALSTGTAADVTSISLTAGDWDVWGNVGFTANAATTATNFAAAINTTSATFPTTPGAGASMQMPFIMGAGDPNPTIPSGMIRISIAATTTVYLLARSTFAVNTMSAYGYIAGRRRR